MIDGQTKKENITKTCIDLSERTLNTSNKRSKETENKSKKNSKWKFNKQHQQLQLKRNMNYIDEWRSEEKMKSTNDLVNYRN